MKAQTLKTAHKNAKRAQLENGGDYVVYLSFYMKKENQNEVFTVVSGDNNGGGTYKQLDYLASLCNESSFGFSHKKWASYFSKKELSKAIELAKLGHSVTVEL